MLNRKVILSLILAAGGMTSLALASDPHATPAPATKPAPKAAAKSGPTTYNKPSTPIVQTNKVAPAKNTAEAKAEPKSEPKYQEPASIAHTQESEAASLPNNEAESALNMLIDGNARWASGQTKAPNTDAGRREEVATGQNHAVTILTCADSRIPVERVFDRGVGDVFVIRVAGNVAGGSETGTIEYGVEHLKTPLLVVMGHTKCGAVAAAATNAPVHGFVAQLVKNIQPAVDRARRANPDADEKTLSALAVNENVWQSIFDLFKASQPVRELAASGQLKVVGAVYDITTGKVEFLGEHPWQNELLASLGAKLATAAPNAIAATTPKAEAKSEAKSVAKPEPKPTSTASADQDAHGSDASGH